MYTVKQDLREKQDEIEKIKEINTYKNIYSYKNVNKKKVPQNIPAFHSQNIGTRKKREGLQYT